MSPLHIVGSSSNLAQRVNNRARLLQMLDLDGNPENGIVISEAVRAVAANWTTPDFAVGYHGVRHLDPIDHRRCQ